MIAIMLKNVIARLQILKIYPKIKVGMSRDWTDLKRSA